MSKLTGTITGNAIAMFFQAFASTFILFFLYLYINRILGLDKLGVWSVVMAITAGSRIIDIGFSVAVTKFVAASRASQDNLKIKKIIDSTSMLIFFVLICLLPFLFPVFKFILSNIFQDNYLSLAYEILPYALVTLFLNALASCYQCAMDGFERMDFTASINIAGQMLFIIMVFILVPLFDLRGLVFAQVFQSAFLLLSSRFFLAYIFSGYRSLRMKFSLETLKEMFSYGLNIQFINLLQLLQDPVTKSLMAYFGGASIAGMYEVAHQAIYRARGFIVQINYAVVPTIARISNSQNQDTDSLYLKNLHLIFIWGIFVFSSLMILSGALSRVVVGFYEHQLITMIYILSIGWGFNLLAAPAYYLYMGDGRIIKNTQFYSIVAVLNPILAVFLGSFFDWKGVVLGYTLSLVFSSLWMIFTFELKNNEIFFLKSRDFVLLILSFIFISIAWFYPLVFGEGFSITIFLNLFSPIILLMVTWINPANMEVRNIFKNLKFFNEKA